MSTAAEVRLGQRPHAKCESQETRIQRRLEMAFVLIMRRLGSFLIGSLCRLEMLIGGNRPFICPRKIAFKYHLRMEARPVACLRAVSEDSNRQQRRLEMRRSDGLSPSVRDH